MDTTQLTANVVTGGSLSSNVTQVTITANVTQSSTVGADVSVGGAGPRGQAGATIHAGIGLPNSSLGNDGDYYMNTGTGDWYGPKTSGSWGAIIVNLTGPQGIQGIQGLRGEWWFNGSGNPDAGTGQEGDYYIDNDTGNYFEKTGASTWTQIGSLSANVTTERITMTINQTAHGFTVGQVVKSNGTDGTFELSQANTEANAEFIGIVTEVINADNFAVTTNGFVSVAAAVPNEPAGTVLYLSDSTAGLLTATEPTAINSVSKPIGIVTTANAEMILVNMRGMINIGEIDDTLNAATLENSPKADFLLKSDVYAFNASKTTTQATGVSGAEIVITWDAKTEKDGTSQFDLANNRWTAPADGWLDLRAFLSIDGGSDADDTMNWGFAKNGTPIVNSTDNWRSRSQAAGREFVTTMTVGVPVAQGDTIDMRFSGITTDDIDILASGSWFSGTFYKG